MHELVEQVYAALGRRDGEALRRVLAPAFVGTVSAGMPAGAGGVHHGPHAMIEGCWWRIGAAYKVLAEPEEWIPTADGRLLVTGFYRGTARDDGRVVHAAFTHLWTGDRERLTALTQVTDTARW